MGVQSLALLRGLGTWHCHELWCRSETWLGSRVAVAVAVGSIPGLAQGVGDRHCRELWCRSETWLGSCVAVAVM